ncbi:MAG: LuxR C-terminal-related transcriptional regulator [Kineosporiaceae bacterium]
MRETLLARRAAVSVDLQPLDRPAVRELLARVLGRPPEPALLDEVAAVTGGVPLQVVELARAIGDGLGGLEHGLTASVLLRGLPADVMESLRRVAVLGTAFDTDGFVALAEVPEETGYRQLDLAPATSVLRRTETGFRLRHAVVREALPCSPTSRRTGCRRSTGTRRPSSHRCTCRRPASGTTMCVAATCARLSRGCCALDDDAAEPPRGRGLLVELKRQVVQRVSRGPALRREVTHALRRAEPLGGPPGPVRLLAQEGDERVRLRRVGVQPGELPVGEIAVAPDGVHDLVVRGARDVGRVEPEPHRVVDDSPILVEAARDGGVPQPGPPPGGPPAAGSRGDPAAHPARPGPRRPGVLTMVDDDDSVTAALQVGARGYVLKGAVQEDVLAAIRTVASGGAVFGPGTAQRVLSGGRRRHNPDLTEREAQVLALLADGRDNATIARELGVSVKTVQNHVSHVLAKLQVRDRTQAALRMRGL